MKNKKTTTMYIIITIICAALFLIWFMKERENNNFVLVEAVSEAVSDMPQNEIESGIESETEEIIKAYIAGEVVNPGVYEVPPGSRIEDLIKSAGGATSEADLENINLSKKVHDEQRIIVPKIGEIADKSLIDIQDDNMDNNNDEKVNINSAGKDRLKTLPGIGDVTADAIIEYREKNGAFENIEQLKDVYRIGDKTFEKLKDSITVD